MKRSVFVLMILLVMGSLVLSTLQVSAKGNPPGQNKPPKGTENTSLTETPEPEKPEKPGKKQHFKGLIAAADAASLTITLKDGTPQVFVLNEQTQIKIPTLNGTATAAELLPGLQVAVQARLVDEVLVALKVMVVPGKPARLHRVGEVTAYTVGDSISILAKDGQTYTFKLAETVKILPAERADLLAAGAWVTIIAPRDVTAVEPVALGIVIHPAAAEEETETDGD